MDQHVGPSDEHYRAVRDAWATRVLDAWARNGKTWYCGQVEVVGPDDFQVALVTSSRNADRLQVYRAGSPAEARYAAAAALVKEDPSLGGVRT